MLLLEEQRELWPWEEMSASGLLMSDGGTGLKNGFYSAHAVSLKRELTDALESGQLRELHRRRPARHFAVLARQLLILAAAIAGIVRFLDSWIWIPFAIILGWTIFNFTVLLHEVVHGLVFSRRRPRSCRVLQLAYALPSGISPSQFARWHLDHHAELGSSDADPKRHYLSPRVNRRWFKALYFTPALFSIYFRAAAQEALSYPLPLRRRIACERIAITAFHFLVIASLWALGGWGLLARMYIVPVFLVFPVAFALNRLGQHYDIRPDDPRQWTTLMKPGRLWDFAYLWSNYHLEHHYFPGVPFYNLPRLRNLMNPYLQRKGIRQRTYTQLLTGWFILNRKPHSNWEIAES